MATVKGLLWRQPGKYAGRWAGPVGGGAHCCRWISAGVKRLADLGGSDGALEVEGGVTSDIHSGVGWEAEPLNRCAGDLGTS